MKVRKSNYELLRIIAMFLIIVHHLTVFKAFDSCGYMTQYSFEKDGCVGLIINGMVVGGVNIFVLISGYFGIKNVLKALLKIWIDLVVYSLISYFICVCVFDVGLSVKSILRSIHYDNWFILNFTVLILVSPILEKCLNYVDRNLLGQWVLILFIVNALFGWFWGVVNVNGYNYVNFIFLYFIARFIRLSEESNTKIYRNIQQFGIVYWLISAFLVALGIVVLDSLGKHPDSMTYFGYNNPLIIISAISLFVVIGSLKIQSAFINIIATGMFGVFLLHTTGEARPIWMHYATKVYVSYGYFGILSLAFTMLLIMTVISVPIERINNHINNVIYNYFKYRWPSLCKRNDDF